MPHDDHLPEECELERRGTGGRLYVEQPFWWGGRYGSEDEALNDIWGAQAP